MRVVDPKNFTETKKPSKRRRSKLPLIGLAFLVVVLVGFVLLRTDKAATPDDVVFQSQDTSTEETWSEDIPTNIDQDGLRIFTDNEFNVFYNNLLQPGLERVENPPSITGNDSADIRIRSIAEERGYRLRASPTAELVSVDGYMLQEAVAEPWEELQASAERDGHSISIVSGYRSVEDQRRLFTLRLSAAGARIERVAAGEADDIVNQVLIESSIPGYSKHHTGYTIDLLCAGFAFENFKNSPCNDWLVADNYKAAKEYGFIPSYPPLADAQGPDPEAWEYVYVGIDLLDQ